MTMSSATEGRPSRIALPTLFSIIGIALAVAVLGSLRYFIPLLRTLRTASNIDAVDGLVSATYFLTLAGLVIAEAAVLFCYRMTADVQRHERSLLQRNERLLSASPAAILMEQDDKIAYANDAAARIFGVKLATNLIGRATSSLVHPDRRVAFAVRAAAVRGGMESGGSREKMLRVDGTEIDTDVTAAVIDLDGATAMLYAVEDVTARLAAQTEARRGQERFALLTKATNDVIYDWNLLTDMVWWNENFVSAFGVDDEGLPMNGKAWERRIHPDDRQRTIEGINAAISSNGTFWADEYRFRKADGTYADIYDRGYMIRDEGGTAVRLVGAMVDMTERRAMTASLEETRTLLEKAQEVAHVGSWYSDPAQNGKLIWSDEVHRIFGLPPERFDGKVETFFSMIHPSDRDEVRAASSAAIERNEPYDIDHRIVRPDGIVRWVHERAEMIRDAKGAPIRMIGVVQDITERKRVERMTQTQFEVAQTLTLSRTLIDARPHLLETITEGFDWTSGAVWIPDSDGRTLRCAEFWHAPDRDIAAFEEETRRTAFTKGEGLLGKVWRDAEPHGVTDVQQGDLFVRRTSAAACGIRGAVAFPIIVGNEVEAIYEFHHVEPVELNESLLAAFATTSAHIGQFVERLRAENRSEASDRYARAIIDNNLDIITVLDRNGLVRGESKAALRLLGYGPKELLGDSVFTHIHPDDMAAVQATFVGILSGKAVAKGTGASVQHRFRRKDGSWAWFESVGVNLLDDPSVNGILVSSRDITDRRLAESALSVAENRYKAMLLQTPVNVSVYDTHGVCTDANPAWERFWEAHAKDAVGTYNIRKDPRMRLLGIDDEIERAYAGAQAVTNKVYFDPATLGTKGAPRWVSCTLYPVISGGVVQEVILMLQDVTANVSLASQAKEKDELSRRILSLMEATEQGIVGIDAQNRCTFINAAASRMLGYGPDELLGVVMHGKVHNGPPGRPADAQPLCAISNAYLKGITVRGSDESFWRKDGTSFPVEYAAYPLRDGNTVIGATVTFTDISGRIASAERIDSLNSLRTKIVQILSQQFRLPLDTVRWNLRTLLEEKLGPLAPAQREFMRLTADANDTTIDRIRDLLTALDIEEGRITLTPEVASIESIWNSVLLDTRKACQVKGLSCSYAPPTAPLPGMHVDAEKIRIAMDKIASNAVAYTPSGGSITITLAAVEDRVRFTVTDTGIGIPSSEQARVFERFFRCSNAPSMLPNASGLGLTIAKHFIEKHGGAIGFESIEGKGSTFWFELPADGASA